jgi:hypothetical protein
MPQEPAAKPPSRSVTQILHFGPSEEVILQGSGYAVRCAAAIADNNIPDALWACKVLTLYGHLVKHPADY